jgi:hypothetical protein
MRSSGTPKDAKHVHIRRPSHASAEGSEQRSRGWEQDGSKS